MKFTRFIKMLGTTALAACLLLGAQAPASASTQLGICTSHWEESRASDYCPNATIDWYGSKRGRNKCIVNVTCTVDVQVDGNQQRISQTIRQESYTPQNLKLCIRWASGNYSGNNFVVDPGWELLLSGWCGSATEAPTAVENGLSSPDSR